jgi:hypothetical protein
VISGDLTRRRPVFKSAGEKSPGGRQIPLLGHQHIDDLPELVDGPVQIHPPSGDLGVGLVDEPTIAYDVPAGPCRVDQQWGEPLHPPIHRDMINLDPTFAQQLLNISIRQAITQIPMDRQHDHLWREAEPSEA